MDYRGRVGRKRAILILVLEKQKKRCKVSQVKWKDTRCVTSAQIVRSAHFLALLGAAAFLAGALLGAAFLAGRAALVAFLAGRAAFLAGRAAFLAGALLGAAFLAGAALLAATLAIVMILSESF